MSLPPLNALRAFDAVARTGSFRAAAETLFVTQPAISHQIRNLENWIGAPVFDRSGRMPQLLPRGHALAQDLSRAFDAIDAACRRARPATDPALVVAAIPSVAVCWLIPRLPRFQAAHPKVQLRVIYAHHGHDIDFHEIDLAFVFADQPPRDAGLKATAFLPGRSVPVCSPQLLNGADVADTPAEEMLRLGLLHDTDLSGWQTWLARADHPRLPYLPGVIFEDFNLLRAAALSGQGVALCSLSMIGPDLDQGRLVQLSNIFVLESFNYYLTQSAEEPAGRKAAALRAFGTWLTAERDDLPL